MTASSLLLPQADGSLRRYELSGEFVEPLEDGRAFKSRVVYAAVHVVCDPLRASASAAVPAMDWDATIAYRSFLWSMGFGVAEAMDTAQRGMGLAWEAARELIGRSLTAAPDRSGAIVCGAGTDQLDPTSATLDDVIAAYEEQCGYVESAGGRVVLMASRALARSAQASDDYLAVYDKVLSQLARPATFALARRSVRPRPRRLLGFPGSRSRDRDLRGSGRGARIED